LGQSGGFTGSALSIAAAIGPLIGAGLLALGSWRLLFLINIPIVVVALACHAALRYPEERRRLTISIDWVGGLSFALFLACVTFVLSRADGDGGVAALGIGIATLVASGGFFVLRQVRGERPITDWSLFANRSYSGAAAYVLLSNLVMYTTLLAIPFFVREVQEKGSGASGTLLATMSILMAVLSPLAGRFSDAYGRRLPAIIGSAVLLAGALALTIGIAEDVSYVYLAASLMTLGLGLGLSIGAASTAAIESAPREAAGIASGTNSMMRYVGSIVGAGVLGLVLSNNGGAPGVDVFRAMFVVVTAMAVLAFVSTLFIERFPGRRMQAAQRVPSPPDAVAGQRRPA
jgi:DHA2 family methylenomycin A resistance protein-like MFS transporter